MKKIICILLCVLFSLSCCISFASVTSYRADGAGITIALPDSMYVFDRKVSPTDERITSLGLTYEGLMASFMSQDIYLDALDIDNFNEILIISEPTEDKSFSELTSGELYNAVLSEEESLTQSGRTIENADIFEFGNIDFVKTISKATDTQVQYTTVYNGKKIKVRLIDFDGNITNDEAEGFEEIIETISFEDVSAPSSAEPKSAQGTEDDKETKSDAETKTEPQKEELTAQSTSDAEPASANEESIPFSPYGKTALIIIIAILICTLPALIFRYVFTNGGIGKKGAKILSFFYTIGMASLFYYIVTKHKELNLNLLICIVPLIWSFVVYKIVKR